MGTILNTLIERAATWQVPVYAQLELTRRCPLDCIHCYVDHDADDGISVALWLKTLADLADMGVMSLVLTGGDPLVYPGFRDIIQAAVRQYGFAVTVYSSWYGATEKDFDLLADLRIREAAFSLYGDNPATHDAVTRRPGSFDRLMRAVGHARQRGIRVHPKFIMMRANAGELGGFFRFVDTLDNIRQPVVDFQLTPSQSPLRSPMDLRADLDQLMEVFSDDYVRSRTFPFGLKTDSQALRDGDALEPGPGMTAVATDAAPCLIGVMLMSIAADGMAYPCASWPVPLGNIRDHDVAWLWRESPEIRRVRAITRDDLAGCAACTMQGDCQHCMATSLTAHGDHRVCNDNSRLFAGLMQRLKRRYGA